MRRQRRLQKLQKKSKYNIKKFGIICALIFASLLFICVLLFLLWPSKWDKKSRLIVAIPESDNDVTIVVFDPSSRAIVSMSIPQNTQVSAARQLGSWKMGSIWQLGIDEKVGGKLLSQTILKTFTIPVDAWADTNALGLVEKDPAKIIKSIFLTNNTNLSRKDLVSLALMSLRVNPSDKYQINLVESGYLQETQIMGGEEGFMPKGLLPSKVLSLIADPIILQSQPAITILDASGFTSSAVQLNAIINSLGGKVISIPDQKESPADCEVRTKNPKLAARISKLIDCPISTKSTSSNFDIEIFIGTAFAKRF